MPSREAKNFARDLAIVFLSVIMAILLARTGALDNVLVRTQEWKMLGSFIAGMFFVSIFTAAPAGVVLFQIAVASSVWEVAFFGGLGALVGDFFIFKFIKDSLSNDLRWMLGKIKKGRREEKAPRLKILRYLMPIIGAIIIASPFPDEIGLAMMGLSKMKTSVFILLSFSLNFLGILVIGLLSKINAV